MTVAEKSRKIEEYCDNRRCKPDCPLHGNSHTCYSVRSKHDEQVIERNYEILFGKEEAEPKEYTATLTSEEFIQKASTVLTEMTIENPELFLLSNLLSAIMAKLAVEIFGEEKE